jgi:hypothetical protein
MVRVEEVEAELGLGGDERARLVNISEQFG